MAYSTFPWYFQRFTAADGSPLAGGSVEFLAAGSGARKDIYLDQSGTTASNPNLKSSTAGEGGLYWIEVMPYDPNAGNSGLVTNGSANLPLNLKPSIAYRITAIAHGLKPNTQVVLQSTFVRQKVKN